MLDNLFLQQASIHLRRYACTEVCVGFLGFGLQDENSPFLRLHKPVRQYSKIFI